jgi:hypothetical protein
MKGPAAQCAAFNIPRYGFLLLLRFFLKEKKAFPRPYRIGSSFAVKCLSTGGSSVMV